MPEYPTDEASWNEMAFPLFYSLVDRCRFEKMTPREIMALPLRILWAIIGTPILWLLFVMLLVQVLIASFLISESS